MALAWEHVAPPHCSTPAERELLPPSFPHLRAGSAAPSSSASAHGVPALFRPEMDSPPVEEPIAHFVLRGQIGGQLATVHIKLSGATPLQIPRTLGELLAGMTGPVGSVLEGAIRPGCSLLAVDVLAPAGEAPHGLPYAPAVMAAAAVVPPLLGIAAEEEK